MEQTASPEYFVRPEVPGKQYFDCKTLRGSLSVDSCAARWRKAGSAKDREHARYCMCRGCPVGAMHAGEKHQPAPAIAEAPVCCRCLTPSTRMVGGTLCVSCYNRQREYLIGRNAKGKRPVKLARLEPRHLVYRDGGKVAEADVALTLHTVEAMIAVVKQTGHEIAFGFVSHTVRAQLELAL